MHWTPARPAAWEPALSEPECPQKQTAPSPQPSGAPDTTPSGQGTQHQIHVGGGGGGPGEIGSHLFSHYGNKHVDNFCSQQPILCQSDHDGQGKPVNVSHGAWKDPLGRQEHTHTHPYETCPSETLTSWKLCSYLSSCRYWCSFRWCFSKKPSNADSMSLSWARSLQRTGLCHSHV